MGTSPRNKKTGASPRGMTKDSAAGTGSKSWLWLLTGFLLGAGSIALWHMDTHSTQLHNVACALTGAPPENSSSASPGDEPAPHFDFYNLLPGQPAITSSSTQAQEHQHIIHSPPPADNSPGKIAMASSPPSSPHPVSSSSVYLLQCGSFATTAEADSRRAAIIMLGFSAEVHPVKIANNSARYRVMVGPIEEHQRSMTISHQLNEHKLACIVVKKPKP